MNKIEKLKKEEKIKIEELDIEDLLSRKYCYDTSYQRGSAWTKKNSSLLIDSLMNDYYIPPILIANNEVVDGKQRILSLESFIDNKIPWMDTKDNSCKKLLYSELSQQQKAILKLKTIYIIDLGQISHDEVLETFLRINNGSIKLNKAELKLAAALPENRIFIKNIAKNENIAKLTLTKRNDTRFKTENLLIRCLSILTINKNQTKDVRNWSEKILLNDLNSKYINLDVYSQKFNETINLMYDILDSDTIPKKQFNTIFEAIFVSLFNKLDNKNVYLFNKEKIKKEIYGKIDEIIGGQMGGGIKFDSMDYIEKRIHQVNMIFDKYSKDYQRVFSYDQKLEMWNTLNHSCNICQENIASFNDFEADHIIAWTNGGKTSIENAQILCRECNRKKSKK